LASYSIVLNIALEFLILGLVSEELGSLGLKGRELTLEDIVVHQQSIEGLDLSLCEGTLPALILGFADKVNQDTLAHSSVVFIRFLLLLGALRRSHSSLLQSQSVLAENTVALDIGASEGKLKESLFKLGNAM